MRLHRSGLYLAVLTLGLFWFLYGLSMSSTTEENMVYGRNFSTKFGKFLSLNNSTMLCFALLGHV